MTAVIPSYNHSHYIGKTIEGLLNQIYPHIELIIIDDASTDDSDAVIRSYAERCEERFVKFTYVRKAKGGGVAHSLNIALDLAIGDYFYMNGSDDIAEPAAIEKLFGFLHDHDDYALVACDCQLIDADGIRCYWGANKEILYEAEGASYVVVSEILKTMANGLDFVDGKFGSYEYLLFGNHVPNGYLQRTSALRDVGGYDESFMYEDWPTHLNLAKEYKMKFLNEALFNYRWHATNTMRRKIAISYANWLVLRRERSYAIGHGYGKFWARSYRTVQTQLYRNLRHWFITVNTGKGRRQLRLFGMYLIRPPEQN